MSSVIDSTIQAGAYATERTKQEAGAAYDQATKATDSTLANTNTETLKDQYNAAADQTAEAANDFQAAAAAKTDEAVAEGKHDVEVAQAQGATYLEQAKSIASDALGTAQSYVATGQAKVTPAEGSTGIVNTIQSTAATALETTKGYLASAQSMVAPVAAATVNTFQDGANATMAAAQPHVDAAKAAVQPHVETVRNAAQPHIDTVSGYIVPKVNAAAAAVQPHLDAAGAAIQPHVETVKSAVMPKVEETKAVTEANLDKLNQQTLAAPDLKPTLSTTAVDGHSTSASNTSPVPPSVPPKPLTHDSDYQRVQDLKLASPEGAEAVLKMGS